MHLQMMIPWVLTQMRPIWENVMHYSQCQDEFSKTFECSNDDQWDGNIEHWPLNIGHGSLAMDHWYHTIQYHQYTTVLTFHPFLLSVLPLSASKKSASKACAKSSNVKNPSNAFTFTFPPSSSPMAFKTSFDFK